MRSQRAYQQAFPTDRILEVLKRNDGKQFDQHLVRRFVQLIGIYPIGNLVRLNTNEIAVVRKIHAPDPYRPAGPRAVQPRRGAASICPTISICGRSSPSRTCRPSVVAPLDPAAYEIDPLTLM